MLLDHRCGHPLWYEEVHVGGSANEPRYWSQRPIQDKAIGSVSHCPDCEEQLPITQEQHKMCLIDGTLVHVKEKVA